MPYYSVHSSLHRLTGAPPAPPRSTSNRRLEVLRGGSGEVCGRVACRDGGTWGEAGFRWVAETWDAFIATIRFTAGSWLSRKPTLKHPRSLGTRSTMAEDQGQQAVAGGFSGLTWIANLLTFLGAINRGGGVSERRNMQQGQGFAHCHREEMVRAGPTANWTDQLTRLAIRDLYIDI